MGLQLAAGRRRGRTTTGRSQAAAGLHGLPRCTARRRPGGKQACRGRHRAAAGSGPPAARLNPCPQVRRCHGAAPCFGTLCCRCRGCTGSTHAQRASDASAAATSAAWVQCGPAAWMQAGMGHGNRMVPVALHARDTPASSEFILRRAPFVEALSCWELPVASGGCRAACPAQEGDRPCRLHGSSLTKAAREGGEGANGAGGGGRSGWYSKLVGVGHIITPSHRGLPCC